ncbi:MAG TPA: alpha/beta hydrolase [Flammeovirgaceae bacterium]|nr:alpha/beta hydrolase [Flammeovirgaceae bacterium]
MSKQNTAAIGEPFLLKVIRKVYPVLERTVPPLAYRLAFRLFFTPIRYPVPEREKPVLARAETFEHKINGKRTRFYSWGQTGQPLVMVVHGWMGRAGQFYALVEALVSQGFHVVGFDGPGHGKSGGHSTNVLEFASAIRYIADKYGPIHTATGHSFGGITIMRAIEEGVKIGRVVMIATPTIASDILVQYQQKINAGAHTGEIFEEMIRKRYGFEFKAISVAETVKRIQVPPLLLVHDEDDRDVGIMHARQVQQLVPTSQTLFTKGLGHTRILRHPEVVQRVVAFVRDGMADKSS